MVGFRAFSRSRDISLRLDIHTHFTVPSVSEEHSLDCGKLSLRHIMRAGDKEPSFEKLRVPYKEWNFLKQGCVV